MCYAILLPCLSMWSLRNISFSAGILMSSRREVMGGAIKRGEKKMCTQGDCVCVCVQAHQGWGRCLHLSTSSLCYPTFVTQRVTTHSWSANQARSKRQAHVLVKLQIYFICIIQDTIRTRFCSCMYPIHDRDNTKMRKKKPHIYIKIRTESQKHHKSLKMFPERDLKWFSGSYFK